MLISWGDSGTSVTPSNSSYEIHKACRKVTSEGLILGSGAEINASLTPNSMGHPFPAHSIGICIYKSKLFARVNRAK